MKAIALISLLALAPLHAHQQAPPEVVVGGHVRNPGPVKHTKELTLYAAIQAARGATEFGSLKRVKLHRDGKATEYDVSKDKNKLIELKPSDIIEVPQKTFFGQ